MDRKLNTMGNFCVSFILDYSDCCVGFLLITEFKALVFSMSISLYSVAGSDFFGLLGVLGNSRDKSE